ncbi:polysaccharide deacetylase family protein [Umezawaea beigongshangensis]|uniref:polysaccharide deacetylase family protein n=1 Tax=Umezawaea beigongshangensis TaxID=2780383 RepID=UPI001E567A4B|nr:polysaccharide deacetylase family protein [Umezawaea beigongshangensis]
MSGRVLGRVVRSSCTSALGLLLGASLMAPAATAAPRDAAACNGYVALTYDDGPNPSSTPALLNALQAAGAKATFFTLGSREQQYPDLLRRINQAGMTVGNHTWSHPHLTQLGTSQVQQEISSTQQITQQIIGRSPTLFRPPYGETNGTVQNIARSQGLAQVLWSVDSQDWNNASTDQIVAAAARAQAGGVVLMHDGYTTTVNAVSRIVRDLAARNLCPGVLVNRDGTAAVVAP